MRVTIVGKTESTITFNTLGIVLRGQTSAIHIDVKNDDQKRELIGLKNAGLINVINEDVIPEVKQVVVLPSISVETIKKQVEAEKSIPVVETETDSDVEDSPSKKQATPIIKKQRGRPKGTTKNKPIQASKEPQKTIKKVALKQDDNEQPNKTTKTEKTEKTDVIVMTTSGPVKTTTPRTMSPEISDSDLTKASIDALNQLEEEEKRDASDPVFIDENKLDRSERMGEKATIVMGANKTLSVNMQHSVLPEADAVKLIETKDAQTLKNESTKAYDAFIDKITAPDPVNNDSDTDSDDTDFLEI